MKTIHIYIDGSVIHTKNEPTYSSAAVVVYVDNKLDKIHVVTPTTEASSQCVERLALLEALRLRKMRYPNHACVIYSDNDSVVNDFETKTAKNIKNNYLSKYLKTISDESFRKDVVVMKVKGHSGIIGNEVAHTVAYNTAKYMRLNKNRPSKKKINEFAARKQQPAASKKLSEQKQRVRKHLTKSVDDRIQYIRKMLATNNTKDIGKKITKLQNKMNKLAPERVFETNRLIQCIRDIEINDESVNKFNQLIEEYRR